MTEVSKPCKRLGKISLTILLIAYFSHAIYYFTVFNKTYAEVEHLVWIALVSLTLGYMFGYKYWLRFTHKNRIRLHKKTMSIRKQRIVAYVMIGIGVLSHLYFYGTHNISSYAEGYGVTRGKGYITVFFQFWIVGMIMLEYMSKENLISKRGKWINRITMILYALLYFFVLTKRRQIIILFLVCMGIWKDKFTKRQKILIYTVGILGAVLFTVFGKARGFISANGFSKGFGYVLDNFSTEWISIERFEGRYISRTLSDVYGYVQQNGYDPGVLLGTLFVMVPRNLLGGTKPLAFPEWYTMHFHFTDYMRGTGFAGSMVGELYLIGGLFSLIIGYLIIGYISARVQRYRAHSSSIRDTLVYSLFIYTIFILPRYDLGSLLIDIVFMYLPIIWFCRPTIPQRRLPSKERNA